MRIRGVTILLMAGALGLVSCGGKAARHATTTRAASNETVAQGDPAPSATATSGGSTPTATSGSSTAPAGRSTQSAPGRTAPTPAVRPHRSSAAQTPQHRSNVSFDPNAVEQAIARTKALVKHEPPAVLVFPPVPPAQASRSKTAAVACMRYGGLYDVARHSNRTWVGTDTSNGQLLYVAGPYWTASLASGIAKSLARREYARSGGLYIGFATFRSALSGELKTVSGCLAHGGPKHTLGF